MASRGEGEWLREFSESFSLLPQQACCEIAKQFRYILSLVFRRIIPYVGASFACQGEAAYRISPQ